MVRMGSGRVGAAVAVGFVIGVALLALGATFSIGWLAIIGAVLVFLPLFLLGDFLP